MNKIEETNEVINDYKKEKRLIETTYHKGCITPIELYRKELDIWAIHAEKLAYIWLTNNE